MSRETRTALLWLALTIAVLVTIALPVWARAASRVPRLQDSAVRLPPYVAVAVYDEHGRLVEVRECAVTDLGNGRVSVLVGDLPAGWSAAAALRVSDESEQ